jgi:hypothetical protein
MLLVAPASSGALRAQSAAQQVQSPARAIGQTRYPAVKAAQDFVGGFDRALAEQWVGLLRGVPDTPEVRRRVTRAKAIGHSEAARFLTATVAPGIVDLVARGYQSAMSGSELGAAAAFWTSLAGRRAQAVADISIRGRMATKGWITFSNDPEIASYFASEPGRKEELVADRAGPELAEYLDNSMKRFQALVAPKIDAALAGR